MENSEFLKLKSADFWHGIVVSVMSAGATALYNSITSATDFNSFNWQSVVLAGGGALVAYLMKTFLSNENGQLLKK